jgi:glycosyltransferase involved in cell wall biosynthesis
LVEAFAEVVKEYPEARLCIVGDGSKRQHYEALANSMLPPGSFVFEGKVPHKQAIEYITAFDYAIMPDSNWYGSPVKILEYGWMKKPIIAPDLEPIRDLMKDGEDGFLLKRGVDSLANGMKDALKDPQKSAKCGEQFHKKIAQEFTWMKLTGKILGDAGGNLRAV